jgi:hypothetical protein
LSNNSDGSYSISTDGSRYCLNVGQASSIEVGACNGTSEFTLSQPPYQPIRTSGTMIGIGSGSNAYCIDVQGGTTNVGPHIQQHFCNDTVNQSWKFTSTQDEYYRIQSNGSDLCLDGGHTRRRSYSKHLFGRNFSEVGARRQILTVRPQNHRPSFRRCPDYRRFPSRLNAHLLRPTLLPSCHRLSLSSSLLGTRTNQARARLGDCFQGLLRIGGNITKVSSL